MEDWSMRPKAKSHIQSCQAHIKSATSRGKRDPRKNTASLEKPEKYTITWETGSPKREKGMKMAPKAAHKLPVGIWSGNNQSFHQLSLLVGNQMLYRKTTAFKIINILQIIVLQNTPANIWSPNVHIVDYVSSTAACNGEYQ